MSRISVPVSPMGTGLRSRNGFMSARAHRVVVVDLDGAQHLLLASAERGVGDLSVCLAEEEVEPGAVGGRPSRLVDPVRQVAQLLRQVTLLGVQLGGDAAQ